MSETTINTLDQEKEQLKTGVEALLSTSDEKLKAKLLSDLMRPETTFVDLIEEQNSLVEKLEGQEGKEGKEATNTFEKQKEKIEAVKTFLESKLKQNGISERDKKLLEMVLIKVQADLDEIDKYISENPPKSADSIITGAKAELTAARQTEHILTGPTLAHFKAKEKEITDLLSKVKKKKASYFLLSELEEKTEEMRKLIDSFEGQKKEEHEHVDIAELETNIEDVMPKTEEELYEEQYSLHLLGKKEDESSHEIKAFHAKINPLLEEGERLALLFGFHFPKDFGVGEATLKDKLDLLRSTSRIVQELSEYKEKEAAPELQVFVKKVQDSIGASDKPTEDNPEAKIRNLMRLRKDVEASKKRIYERFEHGEVNPSELEEALRRIKLEYRELERMEVLTLGKEGVFGNNSVRAGVKQDLQTSNNNAEDEFVAGQIKTFLSAINEIKEAIKQQKTALKDSSDVTTRAAARERIRMLQAKMAKLEAIHNRYQTKVDLFKKLHPGLAKSVNSRSTIKDTIIAEYEARLPEGTVSALRELRRRQLWNSFGLGTIAVAAAGGASIATAGVLPMLATIPFGVRFIQRIGQRLGLAGKEFIAEHRSGRIAKKTNERNDALQRIFKGYADGKTSLYGNYVDHWTVINRQKGINSRREALDKTYGKLATVSQEEVRKAMDLSREMSNWNLVGGARKGAAYKRLGVSDAIGTIEKWKHGSKDYKIIREFLGKSHGIQLLKLEALRLKAVNGQAVSQGDTRNALGDSAYKLFRKKFPLPDNKNKPEDETVDLEHAIQFITKLDQEAIRKEANRIALPNFMGEPDKEMKSIEDAQRTAEAEMRKEFEKSPGHFKTIESFFKKHGIRSNYTFEQYKKDKKAWSYLNFDPLFARSLQGPFLSFCLFLSVTKRNTQYEFSAKHLGLFRDMPSIDASEFVELWGQFEEDQAVTDKTVDNFMKWLAGNDEKNGLYVLQDEKLAQLESAINERKLAEANKVREGALATIEVNKAFSETT